MAEVAHCCLHVAPRGWLGGHAQEETASFLDLFPTLASAVRAPTHFHPQPIKVIGVFRCAFESRRAVYNLGGRILFERSSTFGLPSMRRYNSLRAELADYAPGWEQPEDHGLWLIKGPSISASRGSSPPNHFWMLKAKNVKTIAARIK